MRTDTFRVTHTFDSDRCPFRRFIPVCQGLSAVSAQAGTGRPGGYGCNLVDGAPCTARNCPALTPGGATLDLGVPCNECGATDGWVCECRFTPARAITSEDDSVHDPLFEKAVEDAKCNCDQHERGWSTGGWQCPVHGAQF